MLVLHTHKCSFTPSQTAQANTFPCFGVDGSGQKRALRVKQLPYRACRIPCSCCFLPLTPGRFPQLNSVCVRLGSSSLLECLQFIHSFIQSTRKRPLCQVEETRERDEIPPLERLTELVRQYEHWNSVLVTCFCVTGQLRSLPFDYLVPPCPGALPRRHRPCQVPASLLHISPQTRPGEDSFTCASTSRTEPSRAGIVFSAWGPQQEVAAHHPSGPCSASSGKAPL